MISFREKASAVFALRGAGELSANDESSNEVKFLKLSNTMPGLYLHGMETFTGVVLTSKPNLI